jgi:hypothetical protein
MKPLTWNAVHALLNGNPSPCISVYLPTHRRPSEAHQNRVVYRNLLKEVEQSLREKQPDREVRPMIERFTTLGDESAFWQHPLDGVAILASAARFDVYTLQRSVRPLAVVADHFHVKPLVRYLQSADRFQVLCLTREHMKLYQGNRYGIDELALGEFPATLAKALGEPLGEAHPHGRTSPVMLHGEHRKEVELDVERFFRVVDREVLARFSKPSKLPLVLVALAEHSPVFRQLSQNPHLLPKGVAINPDALTVEDLRREVWKVVEPQYHTRLSRLCDDFHAAAAHEKGSADLAEVARAVVAGRVGTLLVEDDRIVAGRLDVETGRVHTEGLTNPHVGDLLDDIAEEVLRRGGEVIVAPGDRMPCKSGLAATYRF